MTSDHTPEQDPDDGWDETIVVHRPAAESDPDADAGELDETVVLDRSAASAPAAEAVSGDEGEAASGEGELDETVVVDRPSRETVLATDDRGADIDDTLVSPRSSVPAGVEAAVGPVEAGLDATRVVHHDDEPVDATRVVRRDGGEEADGADEADDTIIARRAGAEPPAVVAGSTGPDAPPRSPRTQLAPTRRSLRAVRTPIVLPSGTAGSERAAAALGADAVVRYRPRPIPAPPAPGPDFGSGPEATRAEAPSMRSVRRATRSAGWIAVGSIVGACIVSVVGLLIIVTAVVTG